jgi:flagellar hook assembly protein FlgD
MKKTAVLFLAAACSLTAVSLYAATPIPTVTPTRTVTLTPTISATSTVTPPPVAVVTLNHNRFDPLLSETVAVVNLRPEHGHVLIKVFNASGMLIRKLLDQDIVNFEPVAWDGKNEQGQVVASGVYYVVVSGNRLHKRLRIAVIK